jgi:hypothetical protein
MNKYNCTVIFDASVNVTVEANTPEDAAEQAENESQGRQSLCHQCANDLDTGDSIGVLVYNEKSTKELLDTRYIPQRTWVGLTDGEIEQSYETTGHYQKLRLQDKFAVYALAKAIEAKLKDKNNA